ncbi:MAG: DUF2442 domain-containing protein [Abitibacteriaceae bacterium]|nr:DUF2442 domain-containing protein [Abditibacteriaceae bacterium]
MAKLQYKPISDAEVEQVKLSSAQRDKSEPRLDTAHYEASTGQLILTMRSGVSVSVLARQLKSLEQATDEQLADMRVASRGAALFWDSLDVQMTTIALLQLILKLETITGKARRDGRVKSAAKTAAARSNGAKGGRPSRLKLRPVN